MPKLGTFVDATTPVAADLNAGAAAWATYAPTYSNITVGNGAVISKYAFFGRTVFLKWRLTLGSTSAIGTGPTVSVPVGLADGIEVNANSGGGGFDVSAVLWYPLFMAGSGSSVALTAMNAASTRVVYEGITALIPFTWATGDIIQFSATYEATS